MTEKFEEKNWHRITKLGEYPSVKWSSNSGPNNLLVQKKKNSKIIYGRVKHSRYAITVAEILLMKEQEKGDKEIADRFDTKNRI